MADVLAEITGKLIEAGDLNVYGRGITLEVDGQDVSFVGLEIDELREAASLLGEKLIITIRRAEGADPK